VCLCILYGSQNKQRLFPYTALNDWFVLLKRNVFIARYKLKNYMSFSLFLEFQNLQFFIPEEMFINLQDTAVTHFNVKNCINAKALKIKHSENV
jgi:hypothetical protein